VDPVVAGTAGRVAPEGADVLESPGVEPAEGLGQPAAAAETAQGGQGRRQTPHGSGTKGDPGRVSTKTRCHCSSISKLHSREW
jgi:hypothetical protein